MNLLILVADDEPDVRGLFHQYFCRDASTCAGVMVRSFR